MQRHPTPTCLRSRLACPLAHAHFAPRGALPCMAPVWSQTLWLGVCAPRCVKELRALCPDAAKLAMKRPTPAAARPVCAEDDVAAVIMARGHCFALWLCTAVAADSNCSVEPTGASPHAARTDPRCVYAFLWSRMLLRLVQDERALRERSKALPATAVGCKRQSACRHAIRITRFF